MIKLIHIIKCIMVLGLCLFVLSIDKLSAEENTVFLKLTDDDRIALTIKALADAIEDPTWLNLEILSAAIPLSKYKRVNKIITELQLNVKTKTITRSSNKSVFNILVSKKRFVKSYCFLECKFQLFDGSTFKEESIELVLSKGELAYQIENILEVLNNFEYFVDSIFRRENSKIIYSPNIPSFLSKTDTIFNSDNLLKPKSFYRNYNRVNQKFCDQANNGRRLFSKATGILPFIYRNTARRNFYYNRNF